MVYESKRFIWKKYSEVKNKIANIPYNIKEAKDGGVLLEVDWKDYKPEQISAFVLQKIKEDAEKYLWETVDSAVITVPAYFNDSQRNATKASGEIAGLKVERIINEPTAASLAYGLDNKKDEKIGVFDFWGGTFDITILEIWAEGTFQVLSTSGDTYLWGSDIDSKLVEWLISSFKEKEGIDLSGNAIALQRLKEEAENAKIQLSQTHEVEISIPFITNWDDWQPKHIQETLTRANFENMINDIVEKTRQPVENALKDAKLWASDIDEIILVWWSTRIPLVRKKVSEIFWKEPKMTVNPDEAVAIGAAIQWGVIQWDVQDILLMDVTPLSLWVEVEGGMVDTVIERNTTIPTKKTKTYTTAADNQPAVTIHVVQWERPMASDNKSLWQFNLEWIPPMRRGQAQIEVTFDLDANGILHVSAKEKSTWKEQSVKIQGATNMSDEEIEQMQKDAEKFAEEDKKRKEMVESKNKLEATVYQMEQMKTENDSQLGDEDKKKLDDMIADAKSLKEDENVTKEQIDKKLEEIQNDLIQIGQKIQQQGQNAQQTEQTDDAWTWEQSTQETQEWEVHDADENTNK